MSQGAFHSDHEHLGDAEMPQLSPPLVALDEALRELGGAERAAANAGFEARLLDAVQQAPANQVMASALDRLGAAERDAATAGFEARLEGAVADELAPAPLAMPHGRGHSWIGRMRYAAAAALLGAAGVLGWTLWETGQVEMSPGPSGGTQGTVLMTSASLHDDVDLLLEMVESDFSLFASSDAEQDANSLEFEHEVDALALDMLEFDDGLSDSAGAWDAEYGTLDTLLDAFGEGAL